MIQKWHVLLVLISIFGITCQTQKNDKIIATVYEANLLESELDELILENKRANEDSLAVFNSVIKNWVDNQVLIYHAQNTSNIDLEKIDKKVQSYKNTLLIHQLENIKLNEQLDTIISEEEIEHYYKNHLKDFQLKDYLVKVIYIKVAEDAPDIDKLSKWYRLRKEDDLINIKQYTSLYATNFYYDEENWMYFDDLSKEIPLQDINKDQLITKNSEIKFLEEGYYYFLNIIDYKLKDATSPIIFEIENIKQRILNTRIYKLRDKINTELIQIAHEQNAIKIY